MFTTQQKCWVLMHLCPVLWQVIQTLHHKRYYTKQIGAAHGSWPISRQLYQPGDRHETKGGKAVAAAPHAMSDRLQWTRDASLHNEVILLEMNLMEPLISWDTANSDFEASTVESWKLFHLKKLGPIVLSRACAPIFRIQLRQLPFCMSSTATSFRSLSTSTKIVWKAGRSDKELASFSIYICCVGSLHKRNEKKIRQKQRCRQGYYMFLQQSLDESLKLQRYMPCCNIHASCSATLALASPPLRCKRVGTFGWQAGELVTSSD